MPDSFDDRIARLAARQHGVVTRRQLLDMGLTPRMVEGRITSERLAPLHLGVYLVGSLHGPLEPKRARQMAAILAGGPDAALSHRSAASLWELLPRPKRGAPVELTVAGRAPPRRPGILARRRDDLTRSEIVVREALPVTTPGRTLQDLSSVVGARDLGRAIARAERRNLIDADRLDELVAAHGGRPGARLLRAVVGRGRTRGFTRSEAEDRFLELVRSGDLPEPEANVVVRGYEVDFLWRRAGLAVEVDGLAFHASDRAFHDDRRRDAELAAAGIRVVRVTWRHLVEESNATLVRVAQALVRTTPAPG